MDINWATKVITVYRTDSFMSLAAASLYDMDTNAFRLALGAALAAQDGVPFPDILHHNSEVTLGGVTYAQTIEVINGYTITFDNGSYSVNLVGSNNNIADVTNVNSVSVRTNNSGGLITTKEIRYAAYQGFVHLDPASTNSGFGYPAGTAQFPVNNLSDALMVIATTGLGALKIYNNLTIPGGTDLSNLTVVGLNKEVTLLTINPGVNVTNTTFQDTGVQGDFTGGQIYALHCDVFGPSTFSDATLENSDLYSTYTLTGGEFEMNIVRSSDVGGCIIDIGGDNEFLCANLQGNITIKNRTGHVNTFNLDGLLGTVTLDSTVTDGTGMHITGLGEVINNSLVDPQYQQVVNPPAIWDQQMPASPYSGSYGERFKKLLTIGKFLGLK